jgi:hypothetical protein
MLSINEDDAKARLAKRRRMLKEEIIKVYYHACKQQKNETETSSSWLFLLSFRQRLLKSRFGKKIFQTLSKNLKFSLKI